MPMAQIDLSDYHMLIQKVGRLEGENAALKSVVEKFTSTNISVMQCAGCVFDPKKHERCKECSRACGDKYLPRPTA